MTAQQMVEHLAWTFEVSTGRAQVECPTPPDQIERMKRFLYQNRPTPQGFANPALREGLPALRHPDLRQARAALQAEVDRFIEHQRTRPTAIHVHPDLRSRGRRGMVAYALQAWPPPPSPDVVVSILLEIVLGITHSLDEDKGARSRPYCG